VSCDPCCIYASIIAGGDGVEIGGGDLGLIDDDRSAIAEARFVLDVVGEGGVGSGDRIRAAVEFSGPGQARLSTAFCRSVWRLLPLLTSITSRAKPSKRGMAMRVSATT
jgi:hypothetical protein